MGKLFSLIIVLALGYAGLYVYYGVAVQQEVEQQLENRGLSSISVDDVTYGLTAPVSTSANIAITVTYRGAQATVDMAVQGHPVFSDEVSVEFDGLQALRLGINFGQ
ncbi:hypothetical protein SAMN04487958_104111 [Vreelandella subterranea]|uniref:DUF945 domain-containing protein n=1 Tax=Vreelandella subterranea TaxID=416874 RepID=A0A1H9SZ67_9GAMM|nr:hypothetical protein [Halomonas subterranea]SER90176.1 hypothetical protein SAMN04487958_104111 [Halomonas subterranea]